MKKSLRFVLEEIKKEEKTDEEMSSFVRTLFGDSDRQKKFGRLLLEAMPGEGPDTTATTAIIENILSGVNEGMKKHGRMYKVTEEECDVTA
jgi:hypothetical protein